MIIIGLGNPKVEYEGTRHNTGRSFLMYFAKKNGFSKWEEDKKLKVETSEGKIGSTKAFLVIPNTFMNRSGDAVKKLVKSKKAAAEALIVYDDLDLPLGTLKISFGRSSGGHRGVESVIKALGTKDFPRIRIGVSPATPSGKLRKPGGEEKILAFLLGKFTKGEEEKMAKVYKKVGDAVSTIVSEGYVSAMNAHN